MTHTTLTPAKRFNPKYLLAALILTLIAAVSFYAAPYVKAAESGITQIGCTGVCIPPDAITRPQAVALDSQDNLYVLQDSDFGSSLLKFNAEGSLVDAWGASGSDDGELSGPYGLAVDMNDNVYIADTGNQRIQKFDTSGNYVSKFGTSGSGNSEFSYPRAVTIDVSGNIFVADTGNQRIQKFDSNGTFLAKWGANSGDGTSGSGNGEFYYPSGITTDSDGNVYVSDSDNHRVQKFDSNGTYITQWGATGSGNGEFSGPSGIALDLAGNIYVTDSNNARIQKFSNTGTYLSQFGVYGYEEDNLNQSRGITVGSAGDIYIADSGNYSVKKFTSMGEYQRSFGAELDEEALLSQGLLVATSIAPDPQGNYYVTETIGNRISKFNSSNIKIATIGSGDPNEYGGFEGGDASGQFNELWGVALDTTGNVYVADGGNNRIQKFDSAGTYLTQWGGSYGVYGSGDGEMQFPTGVTIGPDGNVYVTDAENYRIQKFSNTGTYLSQFGSYGSGNGEFGGIYGSVAFDTSGNIYVPDGENSRVQKFDSSGNYLDQWVVGNFPISITVDGLNNVYVSNLAGGPTQLQKFDTDGNLLSTYSPNALQDAQYFYGYGIAASKTTPGLILATSYYSILNFCDHDVSTNNCASPNGGGSGQTLTYPDPEKGTTVSLILPSDVTAPSVSAVDPDTIPKDGENQFPAGLTSFQFTTTPGATKTVTLYYDLPGNPSAYTARKYKTNSQAFIDVPGATITREDYNGKSMLKLTYSITDGGILDQDGLANGTIIDPVGLATTSLADTGESQVLFGGIAFVVAGVGISLLYMLWRGRKKSGRR